MSYNSLKCKQIIFKKSERLLIDTQLRHTVIFFDLFKWKQITNKVKYIGVLQSIIVFTFVIM